MTKHRTAAKQDCAPGQDRPADWPGWVPVATRNYLAHVEGGQTIRELAKAAEVSPSTILRRVRKVEALREDPLLDAALRRMVEEAGPEPQERVLAVPQDAVRRDAIPVLRQLSDPSAILAIAKDMEKAVVAREVRGGDPDRLAVIERSLAEEMPLRGWIACLAPEARVQRYRIAAKGKALLKEHMAMLRSTTVALRATSTPPRHPGFSEARVAFAGSPDDAALFEDDRLHHMRATLLDTPLIALSRRRDERGEAFLSREHVAAGERLREDFELAQQDADGPADWEAFLERLWVVAAFPGPPARRGVSSAGDRLRRALLELGPGMADAALRCCCVHEGVETIDRRLGWSSRSGKVVLRIALWRLHQHYRSEDDRLVRMIG